MSAAAPANPPLSPKPASASPPAIEVSSVSVRYGSFEALREFSLSLEPGAFAAVLGPNGAGKLTLVRALTGLVRPSRGEIRFGERRIGGMRPAELARLIAVVPQDVWVPFEYSVLEMVLMGRAPHLGGLGLEGESDVTLARQALERLQLLDLQERPIQSLSGGERQRVLLARALAQDTPILLLDEPTAHLDIAHQVAALELLAELNREGRTVVAVLHELNLAALYCPRLVLMDRGSVAADGPPDAVLEPGLLGRVYGAEVVVTRHPHRGTPVVLPAAL